MIYTKEKNTLTQDPSDNIKKLDGTFYGIICNIVPDSILDINKQWYRYYYCSLYIPNVYNEFNKDEIQNYPVVKISFVQDDDDPGHVPVIGELCKVMFENGDSRSCQLLYVVPISNEAITNNSLFIEDGVLSTSLISKPADDASSELLKSYLQLLNTAYYVTTGKLRDDVTFEDFELCVLGSKAISKDSGWWVKPDKSSKVSAAKNYFCKPLSMPMYSYFTKDMGIHVPIKSSQIYNIENVILDLYNNYFLDLSNIEVYYKDSKYDFSINVSDISSLYQIYTKEQNTILANKASQFKDIDKLDDFMFKFTASCIVNCNPNFLNIIFPDISEPNLKLTSSLIDNTVPTNFVSRCYSENLWYFLNNPNNPYPEVKFLFSKFLFSIKEIYEVEWLRSMFVLSSGIKNLMKDKNNKNLVQIILLCLTICPWMSYPMLRYTQESALNTIVKDQLSTQLGITGNVSVDINEYRTYSTYFSSEEDFINTSKELYNLLQQTNISLLQFVDKFEKITKSVFEEGELPNIDSTNPVNNTNTWNYYEMSSKFSRLKATINTKLIDLV